MDIKVDWNRRWDHTQQHSAQHLISAIAEDDYKLVTTSWSLGLEVSSIEFDSPSVDNDTLASLESILNARIRECRAVNVRQVEKDDDDLKKVRSRFVLPDDHVGMVRIISIDGLDTNTCCGTHVKNLSELQVCMFRRLV